MSSLPFRQVHLDFHTSEAIPGIGKRFSKEQFQRTLKIGHVNSITVFSKCHHGWAYHPSEANEIHPGLHFDLLKEMIEAAHEIGVKTPVYISAGLDEKMARRHPDWLIRAKDEKTNWAPDFMQPGYHQFCFNTPYLDYLLRQVEEVVKNYDADGIFLDIVGVRECYCQHCIASIRREGKDPRDTEAMRARWEKTYANYTNRVEQIVNSIKPGLRIFHNGGHIRRGRRDLASANTHLELESLPTGGWGYDHFPLSARYAQTLGMEFLGMTGKFHTSWGEFGGLKHPNALRYEVALSIANGAKCSIGDQLHPEGQMDEATYELIGAAYSEVEAKEKWCSNVDNIADIGLLTLEALKAGNKLEDQADRTGKSDAGAVRILLEGKYLFDVIDTEADLDKYKVIILPDKVRIDSSLKAKLENFLRSGGKLLATGESGLNEAGDEFNIDLGVKWLEANPYKPDYFKPKFKLNNLGDTSFIFYEQGQRVELNGGVELGRREDPYFNRDIFTFCSHQHTPDSFVYGGPGMIESSSGIYIAWNVFEDYAVKGSLAVKETVKYALDKMLCQDKTLITSLPAQGIVTLMRQEGKNRFINHLLYASPVKRGEGIEVIEDILPVYDVKVEVKVSERIKKIYTVPKMTEINFTQEGSNVVYTVPKLECHAMVVLEY
jgi:hypothetical protein